MVNSVIWPGFLGTSLPDWLESALHHGLAGVVYFSQNIDPRSAHQTARLSASIRTAKPDALIGIDEEGGNVTRLESAHGSRIPGAAVLGALDDVALTADAGRDIGRMARAAGINMVLAPVADVNTNPQNPVIGVRSFGADAELVSRHVAALIDGLQSQRIGACAKHFPGHGDTSTDSHLALPRLNLSLDQMHRDHLPPFAAAIDRGVQAVMSAHIVIPELGDQPATLNPAAGKLLRRGFGFDGLLITDALDMAAIRSTVGSGAGAVLALQAGADLLCVGNPANPGSRGAGRRDEADYLEVRNALLAALDVGVLSVQQFETAAARIRRFAEWSNLVSEGPVRFGSEGSGRDWVRAAGSALTGNLGHGAPGGADGIAGPGTPGGADTTAGADGIAGPGTPGALSAMAGGTVQLLDARTGVNIAAGPVREVFAAALSGHIDVARACISDPAAAAELVSTLALDNGANVLVLTDDVGPESNQLATARAVHRLLPQSICINTGLPPATDPGLPLICTFGASRASAEALAAHLFAPIGPATPGTR